MCTMTEKEFSSLAESLAKVENVSQDETNSLSTKDLLKVYLKPRYQIRRLKSKGAILVLVWNFLVWSAYYSKANPVLKVHSNTNVVFPIIEAIAAGLVMPLTGLLADVRFGRYKVVNWSIWTMWTSSILVTASFVVAQLAESYKKIHQIVSLGLLVPLGVGFCGFQANIVQFGVDQLLDASTTEIKSFITWYAGTFITGKLVIHSVLTCVQKYDFFGPLLISFYLTVILVTNLLFNHLLIKEPVSQNPFRLVYRVIEYAIKNKYPRQRSAFTYCEDNLPSRIDFGKRKYGGPFTTEQVEDVKTLFQSLLIAGVLSAFHGMSQNEDKLTSQVKKVMGYRAIGEADTPQQRCHYSNYIYFTGLYFVTIIVLIPVYEILIYPVFHRCLPHLKIYNKFAIGAALRIGRYVTLLALNTYARQHFIKNNGPFSNTTLLCLFQASPGVLGNALDNKWFILPQIMSSLSDLLIVISMIEFFCAQVPYSMKGLMAGITYGLLGVFIAFDNTTSLPFIMKSSRWGTRTISCGFWYCLTKLLFLILIAILSLVARWYKLRKREDVLPNEQIFAERYYSKDH